MRRKLLFLLMISLVGAACGQKPSSPASSPEGGQIVPPKGSTEASRSKLSPEGSTWRVQFKLCGDRSVTLPFPEKYVFKSGLLAVVSVSSDTPEQQCKQAMAFYRVLVTSTWSNDSYTESSLLHASQLRTVCRNKANGVPMEPPASDITNPAEALNLELTLDVRNDVMNARIVGAPECHGKPLDLGLSKD